MPDNRMTITLLGTGTSQGVPVIGCGCDVCLSVNPHDKRLRTSLFISKGSTQILIDIGPDFRQQALYNHLKGVDAILFTHEHSDHTAGIDDIRPFNFIQKKAIPIFGLERVMTDIRQRFSYIFSDQPYPGAPQLTCHEIRPFEEFKIGELHILPLDIMHGSLPIVGFRLGKMAYITDASFLSSETLSQIGGLDVLVLNALQHRKHYSHFNLEEAIQHAKIIGAKTTILTHISHHLGLHADVQLQLPQSIFLGYDGMQVVI
ncbi:MAG: MBL fold metallo-hydrolase [Saprospiraceae bacterium]